MSDHIVVLVTSPKDSARKLATSLVEEELAACVNIIEQVTSIYRWQGELCKDEEFLLIIKSRADVFPSLSNE